MKDTPVTHRISQIMWHAAELDFETDVVTHLLHVLLPNLTLDELNKAIEEVNKEWHFI